MTASIVEVPVASLAQLLSILPCRFLELSKHFDAERCNLLGTSDAGVLRTFFAALPRSVISNSWWSHKL
jgi:hypothetical protein